MKKISALAICCLAFPIIFSCKEKEEEVRPDSPYIVSTLAGGASGSNDGVGVAARFKYPSAVAIDAAGNVYVADTGNNRIRKITPDGTVTTFAGGESGDVDGKGTNARFWQPTDLSFDKNGDLFVTDMLNNKIRKIKPDGTVSTVAGKGPNSSSFVDGPVSSATFHFPSGVVVDATGNIYVADGGNNRLRVITPAGIVSTLAGSTPPSTYKAVDGTGGSAIFSGITKLALDGNNNIIVTDLTVGVRKVESNGKVTTLTSRHFGHRDGDLSLSEFNTTRGIAIDSKGVIFISDGIQGGPSEFDAWIRRITPDGMVQTVAGGPHGHMDGDGNSAQFVGPNGLAIDASGTLYVADEFNHAIRKMVLK